MDAPLEAAPDGGVELPGNIRGAEDENAFGVFAHAVHLHEQLGLDASRGFGFTFAAGAAERIDFVDEDDRRFVFARHTKELLY